jgi:hypothetical protein
LSHPSSKRTSLRVAVRESGGLGNQLFQYAALRYYGKRYQARMRVVVDPKWNAFSFGYPRPCLLSYFSIPQRMKVRSLSDRIIFSNKPWLRAICGPVKKAFRIQVFEEQVEQQYCFLRDLPLKKGVRALYLDPRSAGSNKELPESRLTPCATRGFHTPFGAQGHTANGVL